MQLWCACRTHMSHMMIERWCASRLCMQMCRQTQSMSVKLTPWCFQRAYQPCWRACMRVEESACVLKSVHACWRACMRVEERACVLKIVHACWRACMPAVLVHCWSLTWRECMPMYMSKFMLPKRRFWTTEQTFQNAFSKHFSTFCSQNRVLTTLKSASKTCSEMFVGSSKIFVWEG